MSLPACPFPGLLPFAEKDAPFFFGRDEETAELLRRLERSRFVAVIGVSGSGKSSLVHAGLKPELRLAEPPWRIVEIKPGGGPQRRLEAGLRAMTPDVDWADLLRKSSYGLLDGVARAGLHSPENLLVIVDQFEEIFSYRKIGQREAAEADLFVQQLLRASAEPGAPVYVMLTMRTDYLGHSALFRGLPEALNHGACLVPRLTRHEQEEAITSPLAVSGVGIAPVLVDHLLNSAEANRDELPVLQHLLKRLWEEWAVRGGKGAIDRAELEKTGSWHNAIDLDAESVYQELSPREQDTVKVVFQRIAEKGTGERPIRTPCSFGELAALTEHLVPAADLRAVLEKFRARDLLVWADEPRAENERIDIPHECVTWRWNRLGGWIEEEALDARRLAFIAESEQSGTPLAGSALQEAVGLLPRIRQPWVRRYRLDESELKDWIEDSARRAARARQRTRNLFISLAVATLLFAALGLWAWQQKSIADLNSKRAAEAAEEAAQAEKQAKRDADAAAAAEARAKAEAAIAHAAEEDAKEERRLAELHQKSALASAQEGRARLGALLAEHSRTALDSDAELGLLLALEAGHVTSRENEPLVAAADQALRRALADLGGLLLRVPSEQYIRNWNNDESPIAISPDQRWVAVTGNFVREGYEDVRLARLNSQPLHSDILNGAKAPIAFTPDGAWLVTGSRDTTSGVLLWNLKTAKPGEDPRRLPTNVPVEALAISPDGQWLVAAPQPRLWKLDENSAAMPLSNNACLPERETASHGNLLRFSPDSRWLITGGWYTNVGRVTPAPYPTCITDLKATNVANATRILSGHTRSVTHVVFTADGRSMATYSREGGSRLYVEEDNTVRLWNLSPSDPSARPSVIPLPGNMRDASLSPDGRLLLTQDADGKRLWDFGDANPPFVVDVRDLEGTPVALGPRASDGSRWLITANEQDANAHLWRIAADSEHPEKWLVQRQGDSLAPAVRVAVASDHQLVAMAGGNGSVLLTDLSYDPRQNLRRFRGDPGGIEWIEMSNGRLGIAQGHSMRVWNLTQDQGSSDPIVLRASRAEVAGDRVAFEADGRLMTVDVSGSALPVPLVGNAKGLTLLASSHDGSYLVTCGTDQRLLLWPLASATVAPKLLWPPATEKAQTGCRVAAFSPDERKLVAGFSDGAVRLWDVTSNQASTHRMHTTRVVSASFSDDGKWLITEEEEPDGRACVLRLGPDPSQGTPQCVEGAQGARVQGPWLLGQSGQQVRLWELRTMGRAQPLAIETGLNSLNGFVADPQMRWLVAYGDSVVVWRRNQDHTSAATKLPGSGYSTIVHLSPDGRWLAEGGGWGPIRLWDLLPPVAQLKLTLARSALQQWGSALALYRLAATPVILAVAYTEDGFSEITGFVNQNGFLADKRRLWAPLPSGVQASYSALPSAAFSPGSNNVITSDGRWFISSGPRIALVRLRRDEIERLACETVGRNLTETEWQKYFSRQRYRKTCPDLPPVP